MSSIRNLTDNVDDSFQFQMRDNVFQMKYPTTDELEAVQDLNVQLKDVEGNAEETAILNQKIVDAMYAFITPVGHEVSIKDALKHENIKVLKNFNKMIADELGA